ncbi:hypothetical protein GQ457_04G027410 [Hibiscus cannabinus]
MDLELPSRMTRVKPKSRTNRSMAANTSAMKTVEKEDCAWKLDPITWTTITIQARQYKKTFIIIVSSSPVMAPGGGGASTWYQSLKQDSSLASRLLSTISPNVLPQLVGDETSATIWNAVVNLYSKLSATKVMHLHCCLRAMRKNSLSIQEYTTQIKEICDLLATSDIKVSEIEQITTVLNSRVPDTWDEVVSVLIDAEARLVDPMRLPIGINATQYAQEGGQDSSRAFNDTGGRYRGQRGGGRFKGRSRPQCQLCGKLGHLVDCCWHSVVPPSQDTGEQGVSQAPAAVQAQDASLTQLDHVDSSHIRVATSPASGESFGARLVVDDDRNDTSTSNGVRGDSGDIPIVCDHFLTEHVGEGHSVSSENAATSLPSMSHEIATGSGCLFGHSEPTTEVVIPIIPFDSGGVASVLVDHSRFNNHSMVTRSKVGIFKPKV